jgi:hypothetical protein
VNATSSKQAAKPISPGAQLGAPPSLEQVPLGRLQVDPTYQRATDSVSSRQLINSMIKTWDWSLCQPIVVSRRPDGTMWVLDGQHRVAGARARGDIPFLPCVLLSSLDHRAEAKTFVGLNTRRQRLTQGQIFHGQLAAGDPTAHRVQKMLDDAQWRVRRISNTASFQPGDLECAPMLVKAVTVLGEHPVRFALNVLRAAYPDQPVRTASNLLKALFELFTHVGDGEGDLTTVGITTTMATRTPNEWVTAGHLLRDQNPHMSHINALAKAIHQAIQGKVPPEAKAPAITVTHRPAAKPIIPAKAAKIESPVFGSSGKGWCDQCDQLRTREQASRCTDHFCKLRTASN